MILPYDPHTTPRRLATQLGLVTFFMYPAPTVELALLQSLERNVLHSGYDWLWQKRVRASPTATPALDVLNALDRIVQVSI